VSVDRVGSLWVDGRREKDGRGGRARARTKRDNMVSPWPMLFRLKRTRREEDKVLKYVFVNLLLMLCDTSISPIPQPCADPGIW
jgi:hypothetical protein